MNWRVVVARPCPATRPSTAWCGRQARRNTLTIESATAIRDAGQHAEEGDPEERGHGQAGTRDVRCRRSRRSPRMSARDSDGRDDHGGERRLGQVAQQPRRDQQEDQRSPLRPPGRSAGVLAPFCSATAVRDPLVLTGNPWKKPAAMFAAPTPIISRLPSTSWPGAGGEHRRRRDRVGQRHQRDARARRRPAASRSSSANGRDRERWETLRHRPHHRHAAVLQVEQAHGRDRRAPRRRGPPEREEERAGSPGSGPGSPRRPPGLAPTVSPSATPRTNSAASSIRPVGVDREAEELRQLARPRWSAPGRSCTRSASAWTSSSATNPSLTTPASTVIAPTISASTEA